MNLNQRIAALEKTKSPDENLLILAEFCVDLGDLGADSWTGNGLTVLRSEFETDDELKQRAVKTIVRQHPTVDLIFPFLAELLPV